MDQWQFYIISTKILNKMVGNQKTITLSSLLQLEPVEAKYGEINSTIKHVLAISS